MRKQKMICCTLFRLSPLPALFFKALPPAAYSLVPVSVQNKLLLRLNANDYNFLKHHLNRTRHKM